MTPDAQPRRPHPFRVAFEAGDARALSAALAEDVVLYSPISSSFRFEGRDAVVTLLGAAREVFDDLDYLEDFGDGGVHALVFRARVGDQLLEGADILQHDESGLVREVRVFARPRPAVAALAAAMAPRLARRDGRVRALAVAALARPLAVASRLADRPASALAFGGAWRPRSEEPAA
jgi:SnoaL-like domain